MKITQGKINELLSEPGCEHNHHKHGQKKNKSCHQQAQPGAAQGGCAFDGASIALVPITDAAHLVHGPIACSGNSWGGRGSLSSGSHLYKMGFTTDLSENDIIFGGEKKLYKAILEVQQRYQPAAVFVYSTCVTALIGDDLDPVCEAAAKKTGIPVIPVNSPGFIGSKNLGNRVGGEALLEYVIGSAEPEYTTPLDINLIGEYNIAGELWGVLPLFEKLGIRVLAKITGNAKYKEVQYAHRAKLNVMICSKALINVARKMEERYGIPYIEESFYGVDDMNRCLRNIAAKLGDQGLQERVEQLIAQETAALDIALAIYRDRLKGKRVVLYTGGVKSWSIISAAKDLGMEVVATSSKKSTEEDKARIRDLLGKDGIVMEKGNAQELLRVIAQTKADMLIAGGRNQYTALKARIPFLDINQERHHPYAGYVGMVEMARELDEALYSPVWGQVRKSALWQEGVGEQRSRGAEEQRGKTVVQNSHKSVAVNPLKQSQPLGAALAFLGLKGVMPLFHGSQGCTAFAKVMLVRHFREAIPLSTTAMTEVTTILGGEDNIEQAILTLVEKSKPEIIGLLTTGLTETRGDDMEGILRSIRKRHPELYDLPIIFASTPDFQGALQDGFATAVESIVKEIPQPGETRLDQINILVSSAFTPGDIQEIKEIVSAFGLETIVVPDHSTSLDGHLDDSYSAVTGGGTTLAELRQMGSSVFTLALGESMRRAAESLQTQFGIPYEVFPQLTGLDAVDNFLQGLVDISGNAVPEKYRHQRRQLQDAMLDTHFYFGRKRVSLALEPDLLWSIASFLASMGAEIHAAVTTTKSPLLEKLPVEKVTIGDLEDFERLAVGSDLVIANSHGKAISRRLQTSFYRLGFPIFDRLGNGQRCTVGYRGTTQLLFDIGNLFLEAEEEKAKH
ncbi:Nitrogenase MoFe cofactor biosynthesis protein NifE [Trichormus variabilis ATCC 29413]|uniref:Nitrogenase iron-molybdenum cofactor biosynthesis protein NifE n=2 Tax=Anabaena variabilis TaxID=264691 RepID=Q3M586_TRIV2|nr:MULTISPECIES: bifunctional nitrogenase iron-molybdenum cofactor biosynthesis protein NifEN [Nostocaceae]ABA23850.1 Nitrogenase MoFe cofactor biosynthesis protein NifE [Trichormus variabilis ATCC 29413]MBC1214471.1 bifunctional nitrogenase iron-molybdenum cofactor biosynthesis protein NifEN [Trichormus variabilis ARAD]MBC1256226.1 bifunctional nitrogenase iron-molybdenum cofactor biosynthesis protein NifEN [Trichormus variabilis V5]MBC1268677.1 bifunctional nitrogenase iron-molybdenum cofacto